MLDGATHTNDPTGESGSSPTPTGAADAMANIRAAARRAPLVPLTGRERALLAEVDDGPSPWLTSEQFMAKLAEHPGAPR
jgi:hypothetical protein